MMGFASSSYVPVAILSLDQEKAFDRVEWRFKRASLSKKGSGSSFIRWVDLFYIEVQSDVIVNDYLSGFFFFISGFVRVVLYLICCMFWFLKLLWLTSVPIQPSLTFPFLRLLLRCHP